MNSPITDKQQAAGLIKYITDSFNAYYDKGLHITELHDRMLKIEKLIAGWEARGALSTDAVALNLVEVEALLREYYTKNKDGKGGGYGLRLLKSIANPLGEAPQAELCHCTDVRKYENCFSNCYWQQKRQNELKAQKAASPAGPVWVKATVHILPRHENEVFIRYSKGRDKVIGYRSLIVELIENGWKDVEYLDETVPAQQLFTREAVEQMFKDLHKDCTAMTRTFFPDWFNTNYPLK